jgi:hypothetical protein
VAILEILEDFMENSENLVERLRKRAEIRRSIPTRKSVQQGEPDRISALLEEAAGEIEYLKRWLQEQSDCRINLTKERT